jgi:hypothetical protein
VVSPGTFSIGISLVTTGVVSLETGTLALTKHAYAVQLAGSTVLAGGNLSTAFIYAIVVGDLTGAGTITGDLDNRSYVRPGKNGIGHITVTGTYYQEFGAQLDVQLGGLNSHQFDQLIVNGFAVLDGSVLVQLVNGFTSNPGDAFLVMPYPFHAGNMAILDADPDDGVDFLGDPDAPGGYTVNVNIGT